MKDESLPVLQDELIVRLIWNQYYRPDLVRIVRDNAFLPRSSETDGISVFRLSYLNDPKDALLVMEPEKRDLYAISLLPAFEIFGLGLTIQPEKIDILPGHAIIPELSYIEYMLDRTKCKDIIRALALLSGKNSMLPAETQSN